MFIHTVARIKRLYVRKCDLILVGSIWCLILSLYLFTAIEQKCLKPVNED